MTVFSLLRCFFSDPSRSPGISTGSTAAGWRPWPRGKTIQSSGAWRFGPMTWRVEVAWSRPRIECIDPQGFCWLKTTDQAKNYGNIVWFLLKNNLFGKKKLGDVTNWKCRLFWFIFSFYLEMFSQSVIDCQLGLKEVLNCRCFLGSWSKDSPQKLRTL